jgi:hypothetical protein
MMTMRRTSLVRAPLLLPALFAAGSAWSAGPETAPVVAIAAFDILGKLAGDPDAARPGRVRPGRLSRRLIDGASAVVGVYSPAAGRELASMSGREGDLLARNKANASGNRPESRPAPPAPRVAGLAPESDRNPDLERASPGRTRPGRARLLGVSRVGTSRDSWAGSQPAHERLSRLCTFFPR